MQLFDSVAAIPEGKHTGQLVVVIQAGDGDAETFDTLAYAGDYSPAKDFKAAARAWEDGPGSHAAARAELARRQRTDPAARLLFGVVPRRNHAAEASAAARRDHNLLMHGPGR